MSLRRVRAIVVIAAFWGIAALPLGLTLSVFELLTPPPADTLRTPLVAHLLMWLSLALWSAVSGAVFAVLVMLLQRGRSLGQLSRSAFLIAGGAGALLLPLGAVMATIPSKGLPAADSLFFVGLVALYGAACALATLRLAKTPTSEAGRW